MKLPPPKPYLFEKSLFHDVREYMDTHKTVDLDLMTQHIIDENFKFRSKKFKPFRTSIKTAYHWNLAVKEYEHENVGNNTTVTGENDGGDIKVINDETNDQSDDAIIDDNSKQLDNEIENSILKKSRKKSLVLPQIPTPVIKLGNLGGLGSLKKSISRITWMVKLANVPAVTVLLSGPERCGKTTLILAMAEMMKLNVFKLDIEEILSGGPLASPSKKIQEELCIAHASLPGVILFHKLDRLFTREGSSSSRQPEQRDVAAVVLKYVTDVRLGPQRGSVLVVGETSLPEYLDWKMQESFQRKLAIQQPSVADRKEMLQLLCGADVAADADLGAVALKAASFVAGDLQALVERARLAASDRWLDSKMDFTKSITAIADDCPSMVDDKIMITTDDLLGSVKLVTPSLKRHGFPAIPETTWDDIGGLDSVREELRNCIVKPIKNPESGRLYGIKQNSGILLWGPPGCGKTLLAKAVANEAGINLLIVNGPDLLSMYQGESERAVRVLFARAASVAPCVIFFDEFDSLCPRRSKTGSESGSKSTIVNMLLTEMDGFLSRPGIYLMAATNQPAILDPAVLRPGRFDTKLYVGLPDAAGRVAVLRAATKNGTLPRLASDVDLDAIAGQSECQHFTGADCRNLLQVACKLSIKEDERIDSLQLTDSGNSDKKRLREYAGNGDGRNSKVQRTEGMTSANETANGDETQLVNLHPDGRYILYKRHFQEALKQVMPSVSSKERLKYEQQLVEFQQKTDSEGPITI